MFLFVTDDVYAVAAGDLDSFRLHRQILDGQKIHTIINEKNNGNYIAGSNHLSVLMWEKNIGELEFFIRRMMSEYYGRGHNSEGVRKVGTYIQTYNGGYSEQPEWNTGNFGVDLRRSHKSLLKRLYPSYYAPKWPSVPDDLQLLWPR